MYKFANSWKSDMACEDVKGQFYGGCVMAPSFEEHAALKYVPIPLIQHFNSKRVIKL